MRAHTRLSERASSVYQERDVSMALVYELSGRLAILKSGNK